ncbi:MAG: hydroxymethylglutaryl-CoA lyase [Flavobacteriales bacterium]|jgi:hydroxymethylglutaryl-CoA lyase|nr:hydroxymethylglutaryl-CoA lyase [Flavobacteriales bacterium]
MKNVQLIECPRDALQGWKTLVPTEQKIAYMKALLAVGFDTLDCGSFVSPKAIPQMADTSSVIDAIAPLKNNTKLSVIVANIRGAQTACTFPSIDVLGYPFSISENFQMRNTGKSIAESLGVLAKIIELADAHQKELVVYISMGFGNPYGDPWHPDIVAKWVRCLTDMGVRTLSLSDTVGSAETTSIRSLFAALIPAFETVSFGAHLHTLAETAIEKIEAAHQSGCLRFDGAIQGFGGCPMAQNDLVGNMPTEKLITYFEAQKIPHKLHMLHFESAYNKALEIFR